MFELFYMLTAMFFCGFAGAFMFAFDMWNARRDGFEAVCAGGLGFLAGCGFVIVCHALLILCAVLAQLFIRG